MRKFSASPASAAHLARLQPAQLTEAAAPPYAWPHEFASDLDLIARALTAQGAGLLAEGRPTAWAACCA